MENLTTIKIKATATRNKTYLNKTFVLTPMDGIMSQGSNKFSTIINKKEYIGSFNDYVYQGDPLTMQEASEKGKGFSFVLASNPNANYIWFDNFEIIK